MTLDTNTVRPLLHFLGVDQITRIVAEAKQTLEEIGVFIENDEALGMCADAGFKQANRRVFIPASKVEQALQTAPSSITLYDRHGAPAVELREDQVHFNPGSAAINVFDFAQGDIRQPHTRDFVLFSRLVDRLPNYAAQSTSFIPADVPQRIQDRYRLYLALMNCGKPVITGTFHTESFAIMREMLIAVRGDAAALKAKPLAIFDACPSPPLKWSDLTCQSLLDAARVGIPSTFVSMPMSGATSPVTFLGTLVVHTAEVLSGIVLSQLASTGAPVLYGGSPAVFDMRNGTTPMGAIETMMIDAAYTQIGKHLGLPTHAYMGLSDSKVPDAQGGFESGMGALMAAMSGVNLVSGPGMLDFESCQSVEKMIIDHEICGMALHAARGIQQRDAILGKDLITELIAREQLLSHPHTRKWYRQEQYIVSPVIDRGTLELWQQGGHKTALQRAHDQIPTILGKAGSQILPDEVSRELTRLMERDAQAAGMQSLPEWE